MIHRPDTKKIWEGYIRLVAMSQAYDLALHVLTQKEGWLHHKLSLN